VQALLDLVQATATRQLHRPFGEYRAIVFLRMLLPSCLFLDEGGKGDGRAVDSILGKGRGAEYAFSDSLPCLDQCQVGRFFQEMQDAATGSRHEQPQFPVAGLAL
jgi:hypothetical protein